MLRKLSVALAAVVTATIGLMGLAAPAMAATNNDLDVKLKAVCKPDKDHALLAVVNNTDKDLEFALIKKRDGDGGGSDTIADSQISSHEPIKGEVEAHDKKFVKVPFKSPEDTWLLFVKKKKSDGADAEGEWEWKFADKVTVGDLKQCFKLAAICKPDATHVILRVFNNSPFDVKFLLVLKDDDEKIKGEVDAKSKVDVTVPFKSPEDTWLLFVKKEQEDDGPDGGDDAQVMHDGKDRFKFADKLVVGDVKLCKSPSPSVSATTTAPGLPVTGSSTLGFMGVGAALFGVGAILLFVARRRRGLE